MIFEYSNIRGCPSGVTVTVILQCKCKCRFTPALTILFYFINFSFLVKNYYFLFEYFVF